MAGAAEAAAAEAAGAEEAVSPEAASRAAVPAAAEAAAGKKRKGPGGGAALARLLISIFRKHEKTIYHFRLRRDHREYQ